MPSAISVYMSPRAARVCSATVPIRLSASGIRPSRRHCLMRPKYYMNSSPRTTSIFRRDILEELPRQMSYSMFYKGRASDVMSSTLSSAGPLRYLDLSKREPRTRGWPVNLYLERSEPIALTGAFFNKVSETSCSGWCKAVSIWPVI